MSTKQKNSFGMGLFVGILFFLILYFAQPFGSELDLIGSIGIAFGCGFSTAMCNYVFGKNTQ